MEDTKDLKGKGKCCCIVNKNIVVGQSDSKLRIFSLERDESEIIKIGRNLGINITYDRLKIKRKG